MGWILAKAAFALLVVPAFLTLWLEKAKARKGSLWARWGYANLWFWLLLASLGGAGFAEAASYRSDHISHDKHKPLRFLTLTDYEHELDRKAKDAAAAQWSSQKDSLVRKFQQAMYAIEKEDFSYAIARFTELT